MSEFVGLRIGVVHEEHTVSEYYCGGCGWPVTDHDSYCPECGGAFQESDADDVLEAENSSLQDENARLRSCLSDDAENARMIMGENAKLRELVRDMGAAFIHGPCYRWCEFKEPCNGDRCQYRDRMCKLGIEVSE